MKGITKLLIAFAVLIFLFLLGYRAVDQNLGGVFRTATPTASNTPTPTYSATPTNTSTNTPTLTPSYTNTPTETPTPT